ncbi:porin, partial [Pseudomonas aeruginosa]|uniref:porin n=1 Tax=Pseudomonas aeruginosa TaxID=287 RepID=UPI003CC5CB58
NMKVEDVYVVAFTGTREVGDTKAKAHYLGVNWYVNVAVKISAAYVKAKTDKITHNNGPLDGAGFVTRLPYVVLEGTT